MLHLAIGRQRMISAIGLPMSGIASSRPCRRRTCSDLARDGHIQFRKNRLYLDIAKKLGII